MRRNMLRFLSLTAMLFVSSTFVSAQDARVVSAVGDAYVISAKAGGVNYVEGKVAIARKKGKSGFLLKGDSVEINDRVSTGAGAKAEILLNPGSFVRLAENSSLEFVSTDLDNLEIKLNGGSAIFEVFADKQFVVAVNTPKTNFNLIHSGVYRIDLLSNGAEKIEVWKGRAQIGTDETNVIKGGKQAVVVNGQAQIAKFDRDEKDDLELWSQTRAKELAKINSKLQRRAITSSLINSFRSNTWNMYNSFGVWVYDAAYGANCFLPFGYGWRSPYGYGFGYSFQNYNLPWYLYTPPQNTNIATNGNNTPTTAEPIKERIRRDVPPFATIRGVETTSAPMVDNGLDRLPSRGSAPIFAPSAPSSPAPSSGSGDVKTRVKDN